MLGRNKFNEVVLSSARMFVVSYCQRIIEFVWQGERKDTIQSTIFTKEKQDVRDTSLDCEYTASVYDKGVLVEVRVRFSIFHRAADRNGTVCNPWGWLPCSRIVFEVRSVRGLEGLDVCFWGDAARRQNPVALCDYEDPSIENLRKVWAGLGLDTNRVVRTIWTEIEEKKRAAA